MKYISLGAGVQSTALLILSAQGKVPRADVAIFADTQDEPQWVYDHLKQLEEWSPIPIQRVTYGCLSADQLSKKRFAAVPAFTAGVDGVTTPLRRQCTREYKITPIERTVKELLGYKKGERVKKHATAMIGISWDEMLRMKPSRTAWITNEYPLVDLRLSRGDCIKIAEDAGFLAPKKSSCIFCPYHNDNFWLNLRNNYPDEWAKAVRFDREIRDMSMSGVKQPVYLHRTLKPLDEVEFKHEHQINLFINECEGMCGV